MSQKNPSECVFARTTKTFSADLKTKITPCQLGGEPDCQQCGCIASKLAGSSRPPQAAGDIMTSGTGELKGEGTADTTGTEYGDL